MSDYKGIKIPDKIIIVENVDKQGYVVLPESKSSLESAIYWGTQTVYRWDNELKRSVENGKFNAIVNEYENGHFKVKLYDGSYHEVDSSEMAFKTAARIAYKKGCMDASPVLLEPIMAVEVVTPAENQGDIMGDLNRRRAMVKNMEHKGAECVLTADVPLAEMFGYSTDIRTLSKGLASYSMEPSHFEQVPQNLVNEIVKARGGNK